LIRGAVSGAPFAAIPERLIPLGPDIWLDNTRTSEEWELKEAAPTSSNPARQLATNLHGKIAMIYGAGIPGDMARRATPGKHPLQNREVLRHSPHCAMLVSNSGRDGTLSPQNIQRNIAYQLG